MKGYKYRGGIGILDEEKASIFHRDIDTIVNNKIYLPNRFKLNDPTEGFFNDDAITIPLNNEIFGNNLLKIKEEYNKFLEKKDHIGIYSLSKRNDDELLWAYYASGHSGFAIEYDIDLLKQSVNHNKYFQFLFDFDVDYVNNIPEIDFLSFYNKDINEKLKVYIGSKSLSWKHENEYRLIIDAEGLFDIDFRAVTGIYFGYRMQDSEIDYIMEKLSGRGLKYYKMTLIDRTYHFKPVEIEDRYSTAPRYSANNLTYDIDELLLSEEILGTEAYSYKNNLIEALEIVKHEPLITEIYIATIAMESGEPVFKIFAYTNTTPPVRSFFFRLDANHKLIPTQEI